MWSSYRNIVYKGLLHPFTDGLESGSSASLLGGWAACDCSRGCMPVCRMGMCSFSLTSVLSCTPAEGSSAPLKSCPSAPTCKTHKPAHLSNHLQRRLQQNKASS